MWQFVVLEASVSCALLAPNSFSKELIEYIGFEEVLKTGEFVSLSGLDCCVALGQGFKAAGYNLTGLQGCRIADPRDRMLA